MGKWRWTGKVQFWSCLIRLRLTPVRRPHYGILPLRAAELRSPEKKVLTLQWGARTDAFRPTLYSGKPRDARNRWRSQESSRNRWMISIWTKLPEKNYPLFCGSLFVTRTIAVQKSQRARGCLINVGQYDGTLRYFNEIAFRQCIYGIFIYRMYGSHIFSDMAILKFSSRIHWENSLINVENDREYNYNLAVNSPHYIRLSIY